jgi:SAM-dependent methyltransferase
LGVQYIYLLPYNIIGRPIIKVYDVEKTPEEIKENVRQRYGELATRTQTSCCEGSCCGGPTGLYAKTVGYGAEELADIPEAAVESCAACGNPTAIAELREGETVLDLGSGGGLDALLASKRVGSTGKVIGVDMTPEMIELAERNVKEAGVDNVEFRQGEIEDLPVEDGIIDVIISNCVINLSPDKDRVFAEAHRVLKPGGRITVSDIVTEGPLPEDVKNDPDKWAECVAGALDQEEYLEKIRNAGFKAVKVLAKRGTDKIFSVEVFAQK